MRLKKYYKNFHFLVKYWMNILVDVFLQLISIGAVLFRFMLNKFFKYMLFKTKCNLWYVKREMFTLWHVTHLRWKGVHRVNPNREKTSRALSRKFPCCKSVTWAWCLFLLLLHYLWSQSTTGLFENETATQHKQSSCDRSRLTENIANSKSDVASIMLTVSILKALLDCSNLLTGGDEAWCFCFFI